MHCCLVCHAWQTSHPQYFNSTVSSSCLDCQDPVSILYSNNASRRAFNIRLHPFVLFLLVLGFIWRVSLPVVHSIQSTNPTNDVLICFDVYPLACILLAPGLCLVALACNLTPQAYLTSKQWCDGYHHGRRGRRHGCHRPRHACDRRHHDHNGWR